MVAASPRCKVGRSASQSCLMHLRHHASQLTRNQLPAGATAKQVVDYVASAEKIYVKERRICKPLFAGGAAGRCRLYR